jgi:hypothetical protein
VSEEEELGEEEVEELEAWPVADKPPARAAVTVNNILNAPISSNDLTVRRYVLGAQVVTQTIRRSDGSPVAGIPETFHLQGVEGGFIDPAPS